MCERYIHFYLKMRAYKMIFLFEHFMAWMIMRHAENGIMFIRADIKCIIFFLSTILTSRAMDEKKMFCRAEMYAGDR